MAILLAAITRDIHRMEYVTNVEEAQRIVDILLGPGTTVTAAPDEGAPNDFRLEASDTLLNNMAEYVSYGVVDLAARGVGRITATAV